jgi:hypothetical protein
VTRRWSEGADEQVTCQLLLLRVEDGSRRRGTLVDRAGPRAHILDDRDGFVILAAIGAPAELERLLQRLRGFEITQVARSETLDIRTNASNAGVARLTPPAWAGGAR